MNKVEIKEQCKNYRMYVMSIALFNSRSNFVFKI